MRRILSFILLLWIAVSAVTSQAVVFDAPRVYKLDCRKILASDIRQLSEFLQRDPKGPVATHQTVRFEKRTDDGYVILSKAEEDPWNSDYNSIPGSYIKQGDPRAPIFVLGKMIALKAGFRIWRENGRVYLRVPGRVRWLDFIHQVNPHLVARGLEPIGVFPIEADFLNPSQMLDMILSNGRDPEIYFPFADNHPKLTPHEVTFHLAAVHFEKMRARAKEITWFTRDFANYLKTNASKFSKALAIAEQLEMDRSYELDTGMGNLIGGLSSMRRAASMGPYSDFFYESKFGTTIENTTRAIDRLSRPEMTPLDALLCRLTTMTGVYVADYFSVPRLKFKTTVHANRQLEQTIALSDAEKQTLREIVTSYLSALPSEELTKDYERAKPIEWLEEMLDHLDNRLLDIEHAMNASH